MQIAQMKKKYAFFFLKQSCREKVFLLEVLLEKERVLFYRVEDPALVLKTLWKNLPSQEKTSAVRFFGLRKAVFKNGRVVIFLKGRDSFESFLKFLFGEKAKLPEETLFFSISPEVIVGFC